MVKVLADWHGMLEASPEFGIRTISTPLLLFPDLKSKAILKFENMP